jgi:predicted transcriptional regulator
MFVYYKNKNNEEVNLKNSEIFLTSFNKIHQFLKKKYNKHDYIPFSSIISDVKTYNPAIMKYEFFLRKFSKLRNAIVHETISEFAIAEPNNDTVKQIVNIEKIITTPPMIYPAFKCPVRKFMITESISVAVKFMFQESFSQVPIYDGENFKGLLTENSISRWLGSCVEDDIFSLSESTLETVMKYEESKDNYKFLKKTDSVFEALEIFKSSYDNINVKAILISENGKNTEQILGIITVWDLLKINNLLSI